MFLLVRSSCWLADADAWADAFALVYTLLPVIVAISQAKLWIPARYSELERLERKLLDRNVKSPYSVLKVAGLGTIHVPCTAPDQSAKPAKTLVLVHGYAAANGLWTCVRGEETLDVTHGETGGLTCGVVMCLNRTWMIWPSTSMWCVPRCSSAQSLPDLQLFVSWWLIVFVLATVCSGMARHGSIAATGVPVL